MKFKGFSLLEIIIVIAIIAIVSAISFQVWQGAKKKARETETISNLKQTWIALELYRQDNDGNGKFIGDGHELGLPNQDGFASMLTELRLNWWKAVDKIAYGPIFYPSDESDLTPGYESFLQSKLRNWRAYNQKNENSSVIVGDFNHTEGCGKFPFETCFFKGFGFTLDGNLKRQQAPGNIHICNWWDK